MTAPPSPREHPIMDRADPRGEVVAADVQGRVAGPRRCAAVLASRGAPDPLTRSPGPAP